MKDDDGTVFVPNAYADVVVITYYPRQHDPETGEWRPVRVIDRPVVAWAFDPYTGQAGWHERMAAEVRPVALGPQALFREGEYASAYYERSTGLVFTFDGEVFGSVDDWIATDPTKAGNRPVTAV